MLLLLSGLVVNFQILLRNICLMNTLEIFMAIFVFQIVEIKMHKDTRKDW